jgi:hypothetical protein
MGRWRFLVAASVTAVVAAIILGFYAGAWVVVPPVLAALGSLAAAALAVDYFGLARRREGWSGVAVDPRAASVRARALGRRFQWLKRRGSPRTAQAARGVLLALAECDRLIDAGEIVDFLGADAVFTRVGADPIADALRAVALAELGRLDEARPLAGKLLGANPRRARPVVVYAWARVAELDRRPRDALARIIEANGQRDPEWLRRDFCVLHARVLVRLGRQEEAADTLRKLCDDDHRRDVEWVLEQARARGDAGLAVAATHALAAASPYR